MIERNITTRLRQALEDTPVVFLHGARQTGKSPLVQKIAEGSMAASIGLRPGTIKATIEDQEILLGGDVILAVMGLPISQDTRKQIRTRMQGLTPASPITVKVLRGGRTVELRYDPTAR